MHNWKIKLSLFLNYFVFAILLNSVGTVILLVQSSYGISKSDAAVLEPFKDLSIAIVSFLVTSFITKIGYKKAMLIALAIVSVMCFIMPFTKGIFMIEMLFASIGSSFALIKMSVYGSIGLITKSEKEHLSIMNFVESFFGVGVVASYFIFPLFVNKNDPTSTEWLNVYFLLGGISLVALLLLLASKLDESAAHDMQKDATENNFIGMFKLLFKPIVLIFIVCAFMYVLLEQSIMSWLPTFNKDVLQLNDILSIQMASILAGSIAFGRFVTGVILKKMGWVTLLIICLCAAAVLVLYAMPAIEKFRAEFKGEKITTLGNAPMIAFIFPLIGFVLAPIYPVINSIILSSLEKRKHGLMAGLISLCSALGGSSGSLITGNIFEHFGGQVAFYFSLVPIAILIGGIIIFNRLHKKTASHTSFDKMGGGH